MNRKQRKKQTSPFDQTFARLETVERYLLRLVITGVILLVVVQTIIVQDPSRLVMSFSQRLDREVAQLSQAYPQARLASSQAAALSTITIRLENFSTLQKAKLLINGQPVTDFRDKQVTVKVNPGDIIGLDGTFYRHTLIFEVVGSSVPLQSPRAGSKFTVRENIVELPPVRLGE